MISEREMETSLLEQALEEYHDAIDREDDNFDVEALLVKYSSVGDKLTRCIQSLDILRELTPERPDAERRTVPPMTTLGDFRIVRELGRGGMGIVYEAEQISLDRRVALKVLPFAATLDSSHMQRFRNEARAAAMLKHSNIVSIYSVGCERGVHYIAMELIEGRSLAEDITSKPLEKPAGIALNDSQPSVAENAQNYSTAVNAIVATEKRSRNRFLVVASRAAEIAEALHFAHQTGVVHRDIKPSNLLLDHEGRVYVSDFGLAQIHADNDLTITGDLVGTLRYMSPEQIAGSAVVDHRTDVYSLGLTVYELLAKKPAFQETNRHRLTKQIAEESPQLLRQIDDSIPKDLETIIFRAIEKERDDRYLTCQEFADDLRSFVDHRPIKARRPSRLQHTWKWFVRNPWVAASLVAIFVLLVVGIASTSWQLRRALAAESKNLDELYGSEMQLAFEAWHRGDLTQVESKLQRLSRANEFGDVRDIEWTFLDRQLHNLDSDSVIQCDGPVRSIVISPDGSQLVGALKDSGIKSWSLPTRREQWSISGARYPFLTVFSPDGKLLAVTQEAGLVVCDASNGNVLSRVHIEEKFTWHASFVNAKDRPEKHDVLIATSAGENDESTLWRWSLREEQATPISIESPISIRSFAFSKDGRQAGVVHRDNSIRLYDPETWKQTHQLGQHAGRVRKLAFFDDDKSVVSSPGRVLGTDSRVRFWDLSTNQETFPLPSTETLGKDVVVSPTSTHAAVIGAEPGAFAVWDLMTGTSKNILGHRGQVLCATWSGDGSTLMSGGADGTIRFWDVGKIVRERADIAISHVTSLAVLSDAAYVAQTDFDDHSIPSTIKKHMLRDGQNGYRDPEILGTTQSRARGLVIIDDQTLAACSGNGNIEVWNTSTSESTLVKPEGSTLPCSALAASPNGKTLAIGKFGEPPQASRVDIVTRNGDEWRIVRTLDMPAWPLSLCFSPDGKTLAGSDWNGNIQMWTVRDGTRVADLRGHDDKVWAVRFNDSGTQLASASSDRTIRLWDPKSNECLSVLNHFDEVFSIAFSCEGHRLVSGTARGWLSFWDPNSEQFFGRFQTGEYSVGAVEFSNDEKTLIVTSANGDCSFYNLTGR